ncbi:hypothetical protein RIF29_22051 [Crotalaria pallida]|uniref:Hexosyltransferase n=1 Tax=Crotalaria pallida TaxID=3830 RepID=A0AAN9F3P3_CROPI
MASNCSSLSFSSKQKTYFILLFVSTALSLFIFLVVKPTKRVPIITSILNHHQVEKTKPSWFDVIEKNIGPSKRRIKVGLVNFDSRVVNDNSSSLFYDKLDALHPRVETVSVEFDHVDKNMKWEDIFPEWIDENNAKCPDLPMPKLENHRDLNVVVARVPCMNNKGGIIIRDVFRLQVNLVVANLAVESGWAKKLDTNEDVYVVFIGSCGPMVDIFRCDDILMHQLGEYWVYKPDLRSLKQKTLMPLGSCKIAPAYAETGKEAWRAYMTHSAATLKMYNSSVHIPRLAYVTVLHSSEAYVCGAIALAQSIIKLQTNNTKDGRNIDLLLLADDSIGPNSIKGLEASGWKIKHIQRILNPFAQKGSYNEWNYSKLRIWQLTMYDKIIFLDSDLLVLKNIDDFFIYPQLSAAPNDKILFNSGLMVIEPSMCMFEHLMNQSLKVKPYNGGDQGFLNEVFTWWHRFPRKLNYLKSFSDEGNNNNEIPNEDLYVMHYLGIKPWDCYRDYDCNWDMKDHLVFASDSAHKRWWEVYDGMPKELQSYCGLTKKKEERIMNHRRMARNASSLNDEHWKVEVKDPRRKHYVD